MIVCGRRAALMLSGPGVRYGAVLTDVAVDLVPRRMRFEDNILGSFDPRRTVTVDTGAGDT